MEKSKNENAPGALVRLLDQPPAVLPTVVLEDLVPFPGPVVPVLLDSAERREAVLQAKNNSGFFLLINRRSLERSPQSLTTIALVDEAMHEALKDTDGVDHEGNDIDDDDEEDDEPRSSSTQRMVEVALEDAAALEAARAPVTLSSLQRVGVVARLVKVVRLPDERLSAFVHLMRRVQPVEVLKTEPYPLVRVLYPPEIAANEDEFNALFRQVRLNLQAFFEAHPTVSDDLKSAAMAIEAPGTVADFVAQHLSRDFQERLSFLAELSVAARMRRALEVTIRELDLLTVGNRISKEIRDKVEKHQRDFLLREQLKAIRGELGEEQDPAALAFNELKVKLDAAGLSKEARVRADEELKRLQMLPGESPEHNVVRSYLETIASLPWSKHTDDTRDIERARAVLDEDHFGLAEVKERIIEFLAVHQLNPKKVGTLLCLAGPPGVGKTSLGQSIARALGREFYRFSVGGMRDEAEIKGHRRTYIGAMPGRILQGLRQVKTSNPVFMLDELDKIGNDWRGDPSSALLEVLDPAQNKTFLDHYLDLPYDLSRVMFIATVNVSSEIPSALRDRLEIIDLPGYIPEEKLAIAQRYLLPRQLLEHGLVRRQLRVSSGALKRMVGEYTQEAGVRELERLVGKLCRKRAVVLVSKSQKDTGPQSVGPNDVPTLLGPPKVHDDQLVRRAVPGVALGLAWTAGGGAVLHIETATMPGKGQVKVTGQLGEVMTESSNLALSYVRSRAADLGIATEAFNKHDLHVHFPAGAVKKDGPSAGITVTTALISLFTGRSIVPYLAMTGEITLRGDVLPVGGIREKVVAARRLGVRTVIVPERNRADVEELPPEVSERVRFVFAAHYDTVMATAFGEVPKRVPAPPRVVVGVHKRKRAELEKVGQRPHASRRRGKKQSKA